jgi:hypothetical protein
MSAISMSVRGPLAAYAAGYREWLAGQGYLPGRLGGSCGWLRI